MRFPRNCGPTTDNSVLRDAANEAKNLVSLFEDSKLSVIAIIGDNQ